MTRPTGSVVRQVLVGAAAHDAITNIALEVAANLGLDESGSLHSWFEPDQSVADRITHISKADCGSEGDLLIYHLSYGIPELTKWLLGRPERIIIWYHNVTPASYYNGIAPEFAAGLEHGRREIDLLRNRSILAFADSKFNALELAERGYQDVVVASPRISVDRLNDVGADCGILEQVWEQFPQGFLLAVSQLLPHKRADHAVAIAHLLRKYHGVQVGVVWAGPARQPVYRRAIVEFQQRLNEPGFVMLDVVSDSELAALYRACICFVGFSEHEGLSLPPLEAMANRAPVVVRAGGAIPETVGDGALLVSTDVGLLEFSEILAHVIHSAETRSMLRRKGASHLQKFGQNSSFARVATLIKACTI